MALFAVIFIAYYLLLHFIRNSVNKAVGVLYLGPLMAPFQELLYQGGGALCIRRRREILREVYIPTLNERRHLKAFVQDPMISVKQFQSTERKVHNADL